MVGDTSIVDLKDRLSKGLRLATINFMCSGTLTLRMDTMYIQHMKSKQQTYPIISADNHAISQIHLLYQPQLHALTVNPDQRL